MPLVRSTYQPNFPFTISHVNTVYRTLFKPSAIDYVRERLELNDGDFLDLDSSKIGSDTVAIVMHGLEGSSNSSYMLSTNKALNKAGLDVIAVNLRGCSGVDNRMFASYHSGKTEDLEHVVEHILQKFTYKNIVLVGFSLGGNITLKYLGEKGTGLSAQIAAAVAISVPCDLKGSSEVLAQRNNKLYMNRFLRSLKVKSLKKSMQFPEQNIDTQAIKKAQNFKGYDDAFTAPANGFQSAEDYWNKASSKPYLKSIQIPTLLINALDDTFLSHSCYPSEIAKKHPYLHLETPRHGGHVGFNKNSNGQKGSWLENRILAFLKDTNSF